MSGISRRDFFKLAGTAAAGVALSNLGNMETIFAANKTFNYNKDGKIVEQVYNPYLPLNVYIPDGEPHVFGDRIYIYGSHDAINSKVYCPGHCKLQPE